MSSQIVVTSGLLRDIIGIVLVWRFGIPKTMEERWAGSSLTIGGPTPEQVVIKRRLSTLGACLLLSGFGLQIVGTWL